MHNSIWPVLAAAISSVLVGYIWYHPRVFGTLWMREAHITPDMAEVRARYRHVHFALGCLAALITAYVLRELMVYIRINTIAEALGFALFIWVGLVAPVAASAFLWEHRSATFYLLNVTYWLLICTLMSVILVI